MIAIFFAVPGVGDVQVGIGFEYIQEQVYFFRIPVFAGDAFHFCNYVSGHGVDLVESLQVIGYKFPGSLVADVDAMDPGYFLGEWVGGFSGVVPIGARTVDCPVETGEVGLMLQDSFCQRTSADISEADHKYLHGAKIRIREPDG